MIDEEKLLKSIEYSNRWNNAKCPDWVIGIINAQAKTDAVIIPSEINLDGDPIVEELLYQWNVMVHGWEK